LCAAVTGSANAAEIIDVLEKENLFLVPLDDNRLWYRFHHLFAQVLRGQLARTEPAIVPVERVAGSAWYQQSGPAEEALAHAVPAGALDGAVGLIAGHWPAYMDTGQIS